MGKRIIGRRKMSLVRKLYRVVWQQFLSTIWCICIQNSNSYDDSQNSNRRRHMKTKKTHTHIKIT